MVVGTTRHHNIVLKHLGIAEQQSPKQQCHTFFEAGITMGKIKTASGSLQIVLTQVLIMGQLGEVKNQDSELKN